MAITIGLKTNTHLLICSETVLANDVIKIKDDENFTSNIADSLVSITGDQGDSFRTISFLKEYTKIISLEYKEEIGPELLSRILSTEVHKKLRSRPLKIQALVGGREEDKSMRLYSIDGYGALHEDNFIVTGYGMYFLYGVYDMYYRKEMREDEALSLIEKCLKVLKERVVLETSKWKLDIIGPEGVRSEYIELK